MKSCLSLDCVNENVQRSYAATFLLIVWGHISHPFVGRRHGVWGLYKGLEAKLLQTVLTAALMFVVYEKIMTATFKVMGLNQKLKH